MALRNRIGYAIPITKGQGGFFTKSSPIDSVKRGIIITLLTRKGERVHNPEFGSQLWELVFEPSDRVLEALVKEFVTDAISKWEPDVIITNTLIQFGIDGGNTVRISIAYKIRSDLIRSDLITLSLDRDLGKLFVT